MQKSKLSIGLMTAAFVMVAGNLFATPLPPTVPDAGSSAALLSMAFAGLAVARKYIR
jgi:hypothetical protein